MKTVVLIIFILPVLFLNAQTKESSACIGLQNRILNPGAEANGDLKPLQWKTDFPDNSENDWVSDYGRMSHEWNHGSLKGLPPNPGNNYFRLTVNNEPSDRKINIYQEISLKDISKDLSEDTIIAVFSCQVASCNVKKSNCTFTDIKLLFFDADNKIIKSSIVRKVPSDFKNLDEEDLDEEDRGIGVLHEFQMLEQSLELPKGTVKAKVELYCEFPCSVKEGEDEGEGSVFNTFFFDNLSLGFYRK